MRVIFLSIATASFELAASPAAAASSASFGAALTADVPIICQLAHRGEIVPREHGFGLGQLHEYCNSPTGYVVEVNYQQDTMRGTVLRVGEKEILLDGSGHSEVARGSGPKITDLDITVSSRSGEFASNGLAFRITPL